MSVRPRGRPVESTGPDRTRGVQTVDRYLRALAGLLALDGPAFEALELEFVEEAKIFAFRVGITYDAWLDVGVSTQVLQRAGIVHDADVSSDVAVG